MKKILITGADGGLGQQVTKKLLTHNMELCAAVVSEKNKQTLQNLFPDFYDKQLHVVIANITQGADVKKIFQQCGDVDGLVHLAGGFRSAVEFSATKDEDYNFLFELNVRSTFLLLKEIMPLLKRKNKGSVIAIGAKPALHFGKENAAYAASKASVIALMMTAAEEGREYNVRANIIAPAVIRTPANEQYADEKEKEKWTPAEDIADAILFLLSDEARGITGTILPMYNKLKS